MTQPENLTPPSVAEMLRITGSNTAAFMEHIAEHVEKLEAEVERCRTRIEELEAQYEPKGEDNV
jgi:hypothetical protein